MHNTEQYIRIPIISSGVTIHTNFPKSAGPDKLLHFVVAHNQDFTYDQLKELIENHYPHFKDK